MNTRTEIFRRRVHGHVSEAVTAQPNEPISAVVSRLANMKAASAIIVDHGKIPQGIVTERDILGRVIWRVEPETPVEQVMSKPVTTISADNYLFQAVALMRKKGFRTIPVVGARGKLRGVLSLAQALGYLSGETMTLIESISQEGTEEGLKSVKDAQVMLAEKLFADDVPAPEVQSVLTDINADIHARVTALAVAELEAAGKGVPPHPFGLLIFGSGGRGENFLAPDQDNGFVIADHGEEDKAACDAYYTALSERIMATLDRIGFPLCKGKVMATNPAWRRTFTGWRKEITRWIGTRKEEMLLNAAIFADLRSAYGERALARQLKEFFVANGGKDKMFLRDLYMSSAEHDVALGWFGRLRIEKDRSDRPGMINLKLRGTLPLVEAVRVLALKSGLTTTATVERLNGLKAAGHINAQDHDYLVNGFELITGLLLRQQISDYRKGHVPDDFIAEAGLSKREKGELVTAFRAIGNLRDSVKSDFGGGSF